MPAKKTAKNVKKAKVVNKRTVKKKKTNFSLQNLKSKRLVLPAALGLVLLIFASSFIYLLQLFREPQLCYIRAQHLNCISQGGGVKRYDLPQINDRPIKSLTLSPDGKSYLAMTGNNLDGLGTEDTKFWLLDNKLNNPRLLDNANGESIYPLETLYSAFKISAIWSPDSKKIIMTSPEYAFVIFDVETMTNDNNGVPRKCAEKIQFINNSELLLSCESGGYMEHPYSASAFKYDLLTKKYAKLGDYESAYAGTFDVIDENTIIYHDGESVFSMDLNGKNIRQHNVDVPFSFIKYSKENGNIYFVNKKTDSNGYTQGIKEIGYVQANGFLHGTATIKVAAISSGIHAEDPSGFMPISDESVVLIAFNGVEQYDLSKNVRLNSLQQPVVIPVDASVNQSSVVGIVKLNMLPSFGKEKIQDRILNFESIPKDARKAVLAGFETRDEKCNLVPDRYGSLLEYSVAGASEDTIYIIASCQITGYFGKDRIDIVYREEGGRWQELAGSTPVDNRSNPTAETHFPDCNLLRKNNISTHWLELCYEEGSYYDYDKYVSENRKAESE